MVTPRAILTAAVLAMAVPGLALAGEVIAHPFVNLNADDIRNVYLGEKQLAGSLRLVPVGNSAIQDEFLAKVLQTDEQKYQARWIRKRFREGVTPPSIKGSDAEVISFVRSTPGAVGYVSSLGDGAGVKVLEKF
jgi:hypothetical protein